MPTLAFAGAEDVTQRKGNPYLTRTSYTSAQCLYPLADYVAKEMKLKRAATIADDFAFGYEQVGGFQRVFEEAGRPSCEKTMVAAQHRRLRALCGANPGMRRGRARCWPARNPLKFTKQAKRTGRQTAARRRLDGCRRHHYERRRATKVRSA